MLLIAPEGAVLAANRGFERHTGLPCAAVEGRDLADLVADPPDHVAKYLRSCARAWNSPPAR